MAYRAAVVGGSGYTGAELLRLLAAHPDIEVAHVTAESNAGARLADLYPSLAPVYGDRAYAPLDAADLRGLDLVFCALPHGASQALLPGLVDDVGHGQGVVFVFDVLARHRPLAGCGTGPDDRTGSVLWKMTLQKCQCDSRDRFLPRGS